MVGVGRDLSPDTGTGGELYAVIGHAPRHLDRNIAVVGRIVQGIEHMSSLPRGTEALGFYKERTSDVPIVGAQLAADIAAGRAASIRISRPARRSTPICTPERTGRTISSFVLPAGQICATSTCRFDRFRRARASSRQAVSVTRFRCWMMTGAIVMSACWLRPAEGRSSRMRIRPTCGRSATGCGRSPGSDSPHARDRPHDSRVPMGRGLCACR